MGQYIENIVKYRQYQYYYCYVSEIYLSAFTIYPYHVDTSEIWVIFPYFLMFIPTFQRHLKIHWGDKFRYHINIGNRRHDSVGSPDRS